jgi:hypothetical protein
MEPILEQECLSDDQSDSAADFCSNKPIDTYLRVYSMMISDSELSDFQGTGSLTFMWFVVTFVGLVVMLNTLIAGKFCRDSLYSPHQF